MKCLVAVMCLVALVGCKRTPEQVEEMKVRVAAEAVQERHIKLNNITYIKDERADICYAFISNSPTSYEQNVVIVPCEKVHHIIEKQDAK